MGTFRKRADGGLIVKAASLMDAFETSSQAVVSCMYDTSIVGFQREVAVEVEAPDLEELLAEWLNEVLKLYTDHDFASGDFILVEVGEPPMRRYGSTLLKARGTVRGMMRGEWLAGASDPPGPFSASSVHLRQSRRNFEVELDL